jgi:hypothetical protein
MKLTVAGTAQVLHLIPFSSHRPEWSAEKPLIGGKGKGILEWRKGRIILFLRLGVFRKRYHFQSYKTMYKGVKYEFSAPLWRHNGTGGWCFVTLPEILSAEIRSMFKAEEEGWGRLKATALVGEQEWKTAIWYDAKKSTYLLPIKAEVRRAQRLLLDAVVDVVIWI